MSTSLARSGPMHAASLMALKRGSRASFRHGEQGEWYRGQLTLSEDKALLTCAHYDAPAERQHTELSDVARVECSSVSGRGEGMRLLLTSPRPSARLADPAGTGARPFRICSCAAMIMGTCAVRRMPFSMKASSPTF